MSDKPILSVNIEINLDIENGSYRTRSFLNLGKEYIDKPDNEMPRDVILAMIYELETMMDKIVEKGNVSEQEMIEYIEQREEVSSTDVLSQLSKPKDEIDASIDNLFEDEDNSNF